MDKLKCDSVLLNVITNDEITDDENSDDRNSDDEIPDNLLSRCFEIFYSIGNFESTRRIKEKNSSN